MPVTRRYRVGIAGGGQLARMMHQAAIPLGIDVRLLAEGPEVSAAQVIPDSIVGDYRELDVLRRFADGCDAITFDHEHVPTKYLEASASSPPFAPARRRWSTPRTKPRCASI